MKNSMLALNKTVWCVVVLFCFEARIGREKVGLPVKRTDGKTE